MNLLKFAAIDIGTNAVRLLFANVIEDEGETYFKKSSLIRMPIRLGEDVFEFDKIKKKRAHNLIRMLNAFKLLMKANDVVQYRACATSAMREAKNGQKLIELIKRKTDMDIELISGSEEAEIISQTQIKDLLKKNPNLLFVDVGGGSTEITFFKKGKVLKSHSFKIGTIRILKNKVDKQEIKELDIWLSEIKKDYKNIKIIGSGGNINKLYKFSQKHEGKGLLYKELKSVYEKILSYSYEDRIKVLGFNPDRADVIIPATEIFITIMEKAGINKIFVPKIGLADGIIILEYKKFKETLEEKEVVSNKLCKVDFPQSII
ncbi:MAG: ethanolamine ammonia-lyase reactivating factor EutA [Bacteroidales bacterium]|nr:ethanolamine ammonia-lyase reactivating factor EutA [Bacteroidales bacterium]